MTEVDVYPEFTKNITVQIKGETYSVLSLGFNNFLLTHRDTGDLTVRYDDQGIASTIKNLGDNKEQTKVKLFLNE